MKNSYCTGAAGKVANDAANGQNIDIHQARYVCMDMHISLTFVCVFMFVCVSVSIIGAEEKVRNSFDVNDKAPQKGYYDVENFVVSICRYFRVSLSFYFLVNDCLLFLYSSCKCFEENHDSNK